MISLPVPHENQARFLKWSIGGAPFFSIGEAQRSMWSIGPEELPMNPPQDPHPTLAELQAFDSGQLLPAEREPIERHLEECGACGEALDALPEGALEALVRAYGGRDESASITAAPGEGLPAVPDIPAEFIAHPRYHILGVLGAGGMGVVYKAVHRLMERVVALKVLNRALTARPGFAERFRSEVKAVARLAHPNIVAAYDADEAAGTHFLVMEFVAGTPLDLVVARRGPLPVREACDLVRQAALGLQHAHERGLVHCDIKPQNLLLTPGGQVKVLDFGLARIREDLEAGAEDLPSGTLLGTPDYLAPEQARNPGRADIRADIYSLGCTLYHLLAGRPPFFAGTPLQKLLAHQECSPPALTTVHGNVPQELTRVLERMLAKDPDKRYSSPAEVAADLERVANPAVATSAVGTRRSSRRTLLAVAGLLAAIGVLALVASLVLPTALPPNRSPNGEPEGPSEPRPRFAGSLAPAVTKDPIGLVSAEELARNKREVRDRAVGWVRENTLRPVGASVTADVAFHLDKELEASEAFQVLLGSSLTRISKAVLLEGRAGEFHVFELSPTMARGVSPGRCQVQNYSKRDERRRAVPRVRLADLDVQGADQLFPERALIGSVGYRVLDRWSGEYALRLTFYFGKRKRNTVLPRASLPEADHGSLRFSFPPLGDPHDFIPGPDAVFVEVLSRDTGQAVVESNAAAAAVHVMPPEAARPPTP
jgi:serine/threonine protein kinase